MTNINFNDFLQYLYTLVMKYIHDIFVQILEI